MSTTPPPEPTQPPSEPQFGAPQPASSPPAPGAGAQGTSIGIDPKIAGLLAYAFGWISGLVLYLVEKEHREVRFHAAQSILVSLAVIALYVPLMVLGFIPVIGLLAFLASILLGIAGFGVWIYLMIQGFNLNHVKLPVVGAMAEEWASR